MRDPSPALALRVTQNLLSRSGVTLMPIACYDEPTCRACGGAGLQSIRGQFEPCSHCDGEGKHRIPLTWEEAEARRRREAIREGKR